LFSKVDAVNPSRTGGVFGRKTASTKQKSGGERKRTEQKQIRANAQRRCGRPGGGGWGGRGKEEGGERRIW